MHQPQPKRNSKRSRRTTSAIMDTLESRRLMSVAVTVGDETPINGQKIADLANPFLPDYDFGFFRQGSSDDLREIKYDVFDTNESGGLRNVKVTVPEGFKITQNVDHIDGGQDNDQTLKIQLDPSKVGNFQGDVVVKALDNNETFRFEIKGAIGTFSFDPADDMGALDVQFRQGKQTTSKTAFIDYRAETDASNTSVLMPGVRLYHFNLDARSHFSLDLSQPEDQPLGLSANVFRDANNNGILEVGEEVNKVTPIHVDFDARSASTASDLLAGAYFLKYSTDVPGNGNNGVKRVNYSFTVSAQPLENPHVVVQAKNAASAITDGSAAADNLGTTFGSLAVGQAVAREFTVTNTGGASTKLTLNPPTAGSGFSIQQGLPPTLAAGASAKFVLRFAPTSTGNKSATIVIGTDDPAATQFDFTVAGSATPGTGTSTDTARPTGGVDSAPKITTRRSKPYRFVIRYRDDVAIDPASLDRKDVTVTGPDGTLYGVKLVEAVSSKKGKVFNATYRMSTLDGVWDRGDNGVYTISLRKKQVRDMAGNAAAGATLGQFSVKIPKTTPAAATPAATPFATTHKKANDLFAA